MMQSDEHAWGNIISNPGAGPEQADVNSKLSKSEKRKLKMLK